MHFGRTRLSAGVVILEMPLSAIHEIPLSAINVSGTFAVNSPNKSKGSFCFV